jgi:anhydro-N-acetylmuramic acid kinase
VGPRYLGLISGTSADAIDAALVEVVEAQRPRVLATRAVPWSPRVREAILGFARRAAAVDVDALGALDAEVGEAFAEAALALVAESGVDPATIRAIGSHGQTLRHRLDQPVPFTMQIGDASRIAERTGLTTVADFRRRDVAAGGQGAPLLPALHAAAFAAPGEERAVLNLGGIANLTLLPGDDTAVRGFDTGPANCLIDAAIAAEGVGARDEGGRLAASGRVDPAALDALLADPWFAQRPPKSTGREQFNLDWLASHGGDRFASLPMPDRLATLAELSALTVVQALRATQPGTRRVIACGGGVHNPYLMARLEARLPGVAIETSAAHGIDPDFVEAAGFAWLAHLALEGLPGNLPSVTGARGPRILGAIHRA